MHPLLKNGHNEILFYLLLIAGLMNQTPTNESNPLYKRWDCRVTLFLAITLITISYLFWIWWIKLYH